MKETRKPGSVPVSDVQNETLRYDESPDKVPIK